MMKYADKIYNRSPIWFQNVMCSIYGYKLYNERYGGSWGTYYQRLLESQWLSVDELHHLQQRLFIDLLNHALEYVPFYKGKLNFVKKFTIDDDLSTFIKDLPILEKEQVRSQTNSFISRFYPRKKLLKFNTSGTTGSPLTVYISPDARKLNYAFFERAKNWAGVALFDKSITFAGRTIVPARQDHAPFWRNNFKFKNTLFSSYHISYSTLPDYIKMIKRIQPIYVDSYPSSIAQVAKYCLQKHITDIRFKAVITSAEMLLDSQRDNIEKAFQCKVFDQYGCTEQSVFACQCEMGHYHLNPEFGIIEVLDDNGKRVQEGELGNFVCTSFTNFAMPLIRYKIGDMGAVSNRKCECGRNFPIVETIYGRNDDVLVTPDGKYIGRLDPVFKGVESSIIKTQIVQEKINLINIFIVKGDNYKKIHGQFIINELEKRMGSDIHFQIRFVDDIKKTKSGKFRAVINNIARD